MGTENLHHKRKARLANNLERKKVKRESYDTVLIVCEDSKSSPTYLRCIIEHFKLNTANILVKGSKDKSAPTSVVEIAKKEKKKNDYDKVYCVIDRDKHHTFNKSLDEAKRNKIEMIISIPCFEYWLLLHFEYADSPFVAAQGSDCDLVSKKLEKHISTYKKNAEEMKKYFNDLLKENLDAAIKNAERREKESAGELLENRNPHTEIHNLIKYLKNLKQNHL